MAQISEKEAYRDSKLYRIRHSASHIMAQAVLDRYPEAKFAIGPPIENGFYYDFDLGMDENGKPISFSPEDLASIEKRMKQIIGEKHEFEYDEVSAEEAKEIFSEQPYKIELIEGLEEGGVDEYGEPLEGDVKISTYTSGPFVDLCRGPHVEHMGQVPPDAFKLLNVAGAYWRGDEKRPMLQRIYGTAWSNKKELKAYLNFLEEAKRRDHRKIGKELDLFSVDEEVGAGLILWHQNGAKIRMLAERFWQDEHIKSGYEFVYTPHIGKAQLWETSGHLDFYRDGMFAPMDIEGQDYYIKPMNCPFHVSIYRSKLRSYRDLPMRMGEMGTVYRYEKSGVLHGLLRVRGFTQDDAHHFCAPSQMPDEIDFVLNFSIHILKSFGFTDFKAYLSTKPHEGKAVGDDDRWQAAQEALRASLERAGMDYDVDEGGGAFYGPKIDIKIKDAIGREWQLTTIQFDFNLPERFDLTYIDEHGEAKRPYMVHRALLGSMERFFGVLIEHYAGAFPVWLAPEQARIIPITDNHNEYAEELVKKLKAAGVRAKADYSSDRMNAKIRNAQMMKVPYMLVIGDKELESKTIALRKRDGSRINEMPVEDFLALVNDRVETQSVEL